jgi:hypothetical protein
LVAMIISMTGILPALISSTNPPHLGIYPNYILVYLHDLVVPQSCILIATAIQFLNNRQLMNWTIRQSKSAIDNIKQVFWSQINNFNFNSK